LLHRGTAFYGLVHVTTRKKPRDFKDIGRLLLKSGRPTRVINLITLYRIVTFPLLVCLIIQGNTQWFKWLLAASFFTDAIDGFLARKYKATSILGAKLDSIGDDLTVLAAAIGLFTFHFEFVKENIVVFAALFCLFLIQVGLSIYRYRKISTFHTYLAKTAAVVTAIFMLSVFFLGKVSYPLFYAAAALTGVELIEEIILVLLLRDYTSNVKGLYWALRKNKKHGDA